MKLWLQLLILVFTSCQHPVFADLANPIAVANDVSANPLNFSLTDTYFKSVKCFELNVEYAMSCAEGYNAAAALTSTAPQLIGRAELSDRYTVVEDFQELLFVTEKTPMKIRSFREFLARRDQKLANLETAVAAWVAKVNKQIPAPFVYSEKIKNLRTVIPTTTTTPAIVLAALDGQVKSRDPHGFVIDRESFEKFQGSADPEIVGVGVLLHPSEFAYRFQRVIPGSGGAKAGLKDRDLLLAVNGEAIGFDLSIDQVALKLQGPKGSTVALQIDRGGKVLEFTIMREAFQMKNLETRYFPDTQTGYLKIARFSATGDQGLSLCEEFRMQLNDLKEDGATNWILDLRDNGGGFIDQAVCLLGLFVGPKQVALQSKAPGAFDKMQVTLTQEEKFLTCPLVVLQNEVSASASELFAGAVQDLQRGWIVGARSFGKGSLQDFNELADAPMHAVQAQTIQIFYQPNGRTNQGVGIIPDVETYLDGRDQLAWVPREFDLFPKALKTTPQAWVSPRPEALKNLNACVKTQPWLQIPAGLDAQLNQALVTLQCAN